MGLVTTGMCIMRWTANKMHPFWQ